MNKMAKKTKVALIYDFDGTLCEHYMQDYGLIPLVGMKPKDFWPMANKWSADHDADQITGSMFYFLKKSFEEGVTLTREKMKETGKNIKYYAGVEDWFKRISKYGEALDLEIEHYIISAGYEEILEGTKIRKFFKDVFSCSFAYSKDGRPVWPARVVNYSAKTQYLSKINKGLKKNDDREVNEFLPDEDRPIPYQRMIFFGDGMTDIPAMRMVKDKGGHSVAVYKPRSKSKSQAIKLLLDNRVSFALPADYSENKELDHVVRTILDKISTERDLEELKAREEKKKDAAIKKLKIIGVDEPLEGVHTMGNEAAK